MSHYRYGPEYPEPVKTFSGIAYGIHYFASEEEAELAGRLVRAKGDTFNGGFFDGVPCGRDPYRDHEDAKHGKVYAVTVA